MIVLDATIVNVAIPTIHSSLHFSTDNLEWLITAYALTFGGLLAVRRSNRRPVRASGACS